MVSSGFPSSTSPPRSGGTLSGPVVHRGVCSSNPRTRANPAKSLSVVRMASFRRMLTAERTIRKAVEADGRLVATSTAFLSLLPDSSLVS